MINGAGRRGYPLSMHPFRRFALAALALFAFAVCARDPQERVAWVHLKADGPDAWSAALALDSSAPEPLFPEAPSTLRAEAVQIEQATGEPAPDLTRWYRVRVEPEQAENLASALRGEPGVEVAFVAPEPELASFVPTGVPAAAPLGPGDSCPIRTPSYEPYQGYLSAAPSGIDAPAAWTRPGGRGAGVWFADIEGGWNTRHEDLPGDRMEHVAGRIIEERGWIAHGTAVLGEVAARDNGLGMVGIAPDVERIFTASIGGLPPAAAIHAAQAKLRPGDVLLIELHAVGPRGYWLPMEFWDDVWDVIRLATSRGVVVIEAAGNGAEDLDHPEYRGKLDRRLRDSGAIMVGAGAPARSGWVDRSRLDFSNYGSRVDVQGWGRRVATLEYGDLQSCSERGERHYTDQFSGTSSASPVVAGAAMLVQSVAKAELGRPLTPLELRDRLIATGSPQTDGPHGPATQHIGPRPDLARALRWQ
jgi:subtilisin family serine protease